MLFNQISAFSLAFIGASAAALSSKSTTTGELSCVSKCWTNSQYVSSCAGNSKCLCDDAEFQNALYQCLYSQCQTAQFGDALHQSLGLCQAAAADESIPYVAPVRVNDLKKRQMKTMSNSVTHTSHTRSTGVVGPIATGTTTTCTETTQTVIANPTGGAPGYPSQYQPGSPSAVLPTGGAPSYPSAYQPGQPGAYPSAYQPGAPPAASGPVLSAPAYGAPSAYQPSIVAPISGMPSAYMPSNTMSISANPTYSSSRASPTAYYGTTVYVTVDPSVVVVTVTVTSTSMPVSTITVEPVAMVSPTPYAYSS